MRVITFGTFDLFHVGHLRLLQRAKELGTWLVVGVSSDELNYEKKGKYPAAPIEHRMEIIRSIRYVDEVFVEESLEEKRRYIIEYRADVLVMGDDWSGQFDHVSDLCRVVYLPRTPGISTTEIKDQIRHAQSCEYSLQEAVASFPGTSSS